VRSQPWQRVQRDLFQRSAGRFPALDGMRALAALMIVYFHATGVVPGLTIFTFPLGLGSLWIGVDIFFVLSGFLIGHILLLQMQRGGVAFRSFYVRRAFRIFPAYYVVLTLNVLVFIHLGVFSPIHFNIPWALWLKFSIPSYLYLCNYIRTTEVMGWAWSLCVEEHFYLIFPTILVLLFRFSPRIRLVGLLILALLPLAIRTIAFIDDPGVRLFPQLLLESHTHCDGLFIGVLVAYLFVYHRGQLARFATRLSPLLLATAFACYASALWAGGATATLQTGFLRVVALLFLLAVGTALIITNVLFVDNVVSRVLAHPFWYPIARVSYGMYLIHPFVAYWLVSFVPGSRVDIAGSLVRLIAFGTVTALATFLCACLLFVLVERPMLSRGARFATANSSSKSRS
jgi:peptidoglycan/LPS O-acetylase OafA/YrhL